MNPDGTSTRNWATSVVLSKLDGRKTLWNNFIQKETGRIFSGDIIFTCTVIVQLCFCTKRIGHFNISSTTLPPPVSPQNETILQSIPHFQ